jgi:exodeoxyribonuclease VIII
MFEAIDPGRIDPGMSNEDYHLAPEIGNSGLTGINRSVAHFLFSRAASDAPRSAPLLEGQALHCRFLEPNEFRKRFAMTPEEIDRRTKAGKEAYREFLEDAEGKQILNDDQNQRGAAMAAHLNSHQRVSELVDLKNGHAEVSIFWDHAGIGCKARPDYVSPDGKILVDLKTSADASPEAFAKSIVNFGYHRQAAWYLQGWRRVTGYHADFVFVVVEKQPPHGIACYTLDEAALAEGWLQCRNILAKYSAFLSEPEEARNAGYPTDIQELTLPRWAFTE